MESARPGTRTRSLPTGTVSFLFTDIQGSTELLHKLGDQAYGEVLLTHQRLLRQSFEEHEGAEVDTQGDAFFVAFPRSWNAVGAAVAAQRTLASHPWPDGVQVRVRMGIHTGEPTLAGDHYVGLDVHRAARIAATGYGQQVLLSERSHAMTQGNIPEGVEVRDLGEHRLKDIHRPEHIFQLLIPGLPADFPPLKSLEILVTNLPSLQQTSFVGREREMAEIKARLGAARMVTLLGPGGTGKTRLALQVGGGLLEQYPKGVWLVELGPVSDPEVVVQTVAAVFNVREAPSHTLLDMLIEYLKPRELLLILDNCEHLVEASARLAHALLRGCPQLRILATSREPLGVAGEALYRVPPMSRPDPTRVLTADQLGQFEAAQLFIERAILGNPQFMVTDRIAPVVARVVHRLDGIPLAIELAAARVKVLSVEQIAARLDDRFRLLTAGVRVGLPHHQTLRATIDWSHELLSVPERTLFRRLSVFAGGFSLDAAEAVCPGGEIDTLDVLDSLARLVDKSLLLTEELDGDVRYRMLETIREYGREKLAAAGEQAELHSRHLQWQLALAEQAEPHLRGPEQITWLDRLELDHDDLRTALEWSRTGGDTGAGLRLAGALSIFWARRGHFSEGRERFSAAESAASTAPAAVGAKAIYGAGLLASLQADFARAELLCNQSLALYRELGDRSGAALSLAVLGGIARNRGDFPQAAALLEEGLALARETDDKWTLAELLRGLGLMARRQGDNRRAKALLEESLTLWRAVGDKWGLAYCLTHLGVVAGTEGNFERARILYEESLALAKELGDRNQVAEIFGTLGSLAMDRGDFERATALLEESLVLSRELGNKREVAVALGNLAFATYRRGDFQRATTLLEDSRALFHELGDKRNIATALVILGIMAHHNEEPERAGRLFAEGLSLYREIGDRLGIAECLEGLGAVAATQGNLEQAARLLGVAEGLRDAMATPIPPSERAEYDRVVSAVRGALPEPIFSEAWERGRAIPLDEAVEDALRFAGPAGPVQKPSYPP